MKVAPALVALLAVAFLALTLAEANPIGSEVKPLGSIANPVIAVSVGDEAMNEILDEAKVSRDLALKLSKNYMEEAQKSGDALNAAKYAVASKLMASIASCRYHDAVFTSESDIHGRNLERELGIYHLHAENNNQRMDGKLESLMKLATELPSGNTIATDVKAIVEAMAESIVFISKLGEKYSEE